MTDLILNQICCWFTKPTENLDPRLTPGPELLSNNNSGFLGKIQSAVMDLHPESSDMDALP